MDDARKSCRCFPRTACRRLSSTPSGSGCELTAQPDDTAAIVREKERTLAALHAKDSSLATWSRLLDLWCAGWFWSNGAPPDRRTFRELTARLLEGSCALPERQCSQFLGHSDATAERAADSITGRSCFLRSSSMSRDGYGRRRASTRSSAIRRGRWCAATQATRTRGRRERRSRPAAHRLRARVRHLSRGELGTRQSVSAVRRAGAATGSSAAAASASCCRRDW